MESDAAREDAAQAGRAWTLRRRVVLLMAARLGLVVATFALTLALFGAGDEEAARAESGLYGTLGAAFLATALYGLVLRFVRRLELFAALQLATDVACVSALVVFSGGSDSPFSFLYLPVAVYGAILFDRRGGYGSALTASAGYGLALCLVGPLGAGEWLGRPPGSGAVVAWAVLSGALALVALLASALSRALRLAGERLDARDHDLARLRWLHERTIESLTSGLLTLDHEGRITSFNPEAERITGRRSGEVRGERLDQLLPGAAAIVATGEQGRAPQSRRRLAFVNHYGEQRHLGLAGSVLRDVDGRPSGHVVIFQDVTEVVAMERDLRRSERLAGIGQLAADIAHEIRNPLAAISGSVQMLRGAPHAAVDEAEGRRLMGIVLREIDRLDALITDFLQYARPAPPKPECVPLAAVIGEVGEMCRRALPEAVALRVDVEGDPAIRVDPAQLRQALWNLVANATQAMPDGGRLRITAAPAAPQGGPPRDRKGGAERSPEVEIRVTDTGAGMPPEVLERIFDPFFTTKPRGTGLGLPTVHRIVEGNGGALQVESEPGRGTEFRLRFPAAEVEG